MVARPQGTTSWWAVAVVIALLGLTGCAKEAPPSLLSDQGAATRVEQREEQALLNQRATAVMRRDLKAFLATIDTTNSQLRQRQVRWFRNVSALPVKTLRYDVRTDRWPAQLFAGTTAKSPAPLRVVMSLQLRGIDQAPSRQVTGFRMGGEGKRMRVVADQPVGASFVPGYQPQPWDLGRIQVARAPGVTVIYDQASAASMGIVRDATVKGLQALRDLIPFAAPPSVAVFVLSEKRFQRFYPRLPGGSIKQLGAVTFPVRAGPADQSVVSRRVVVLPSSVTAGPQFIDRLVRHELTHVVLAEHDDGVPLWLSEGLAEYAAQEPIARTLQRIDARAPDIARRGVAKLPASTGFNGPRQGWNYALSWVAVDYIAQQRGTAKLWKLLSLMNRGGRGTPDADQDRVLRRVIGMDSAQLARRAGEQIVRTYG